MKTIIGKVIPCNYGSIPHLSTSKLTQQADKKINSGQEGFLTKKTRDWKDLIVVTEKLDGSNTGIYMKNGQPVPITRAGYDARTSQFKQHHYFADWVFQNRDKFGYLPNGWRVCGEWMAMAHGTIYDVTTEPLFVAFDIIDNENKRLCYLDFIKICSVMNLPSVRLLHIGQPISVKNAVKLLEKEPYGGTDKPEGVVYRCEREGRVDFMAKHVRADKVDGKYMKEEIWNTGFLPSYQQDPDR